MVASPAPSTRAALISVLSTLITPPYTATTPDRNDARKITNTLGNSPIPMVTIASGITASGGIMRKNCT